MTYYNKYAGRFNRYLANRMSELGLTQTDVAKRIGVNGSYINVMMKPKIGDQPNTRMFSLDLWPSLADVLKTDFSKLSTMLFEEHAPRFAARLAAEQMLPTLETPHAVVEIPVLLNDTGYAGEYVEKIMQLDPGPRLVIAEMIDKLLMEQERVAGETAAEAELQTA